MTRIRNWKGSHLFRPSAECRYAHLDSLFTAQVDWHLIATMLPDMLRIALSIKAGHVTPSTVLRRLATYSRKNKLYSHSGNWVEWSVPFSYCTTSPASSYDTRSKQRPTKATRSTNFVQWVCFSGDGVIIENVRDEQRKFIKYNHLVANLLAFHTLVTITKALRELLEQGHTADREALATLSPY